MSRRPGNFSHQFVGRRKKVVSGWRDFDPFHPHATNNGFPNSQLASLTVNSSRQLVATFNDAIATAGSTLAGSDVYAIPLTNKDGTRVTFADSFTLKTQVEIISASGDIKNETNYAQPFVALGIGQHADADNSTNHYASYGIWLWDRDGSNNIKMAGCGFRTKDVDDHSTVQEFDTGGIIDFKGNPPTGQVITDYYLGPGLGSAFTDTNVVNLANWIGENQTDSYTKRSVPGFDLSNANGQFDVDTQVYLYAVFGVKAAIDGSEDQASVTCRLRYMVNSNDGKDGTATA
jgi:hypothetical protein|tara:strand:+ start:3584 stop:4450 length:867 start_codon:yes stop_codon:yes gene_type:complete